MNREEQKALVKAWELHSKILRDIRDLALMNATLAHGCIRTAELLVDLMLVDRLRRIQENSSTKEPPCSV